MTFKLRRNSSSGPHVEVSVFVGADRGHLQLAGELRLQPPEWIAISTMLMHGAIAARAVLDEAELLISDCDLAKGLEIEIPLHIPRTW